MYLTGLELFFLVGGVGGAQPSPKPGTCVAGNSGAGMQDPKEDEFFGYSNKAASTGRRKIKTALGG